MFETIKTSTSEGIFTITLNRPDALNALNQTVLSELEEAISSTYDDESIRALILTGEGEKAFVAGADIKEISEVSELNARKFAERGQELFALLENHHKPVIAAVNGFALGGGCELAMACHLRIATKTARFGQPEPKLGLIPGYGGTQRLTQLIGKGKALELMMTSDMVSAEDALRLGLVNKVVENQEELLPAANEMLKKILSMAPTSIGMIIDSVNAFFDEEKNGYQVEANGFARCVSTSDFKEGTSAFIEKRPPEFTGN